jgi:hypothetical protein
VAGSSKTILATAKMFTLALYSVKSKVTNLWWYRDRTHKRFLKVFFVT